MVNELAMNDHDDMYVEWFELPVLWAGGKAW